MQPTSAPPLALPARLQGNTSMAPKQILILDDDKNLLEGFAEGLRRNGHFVVACTRFEEARRQLACFVPDILITDVRVGEFNGLFLALLYRRLSPDGRAIVMTAYGDPVLQKEAAQMGAEFLMKPITLAELEDHFEAQPLTVQHSQR